jgi:PAS domain S-box-containing protein
LVQPLDSEELLATVDALLRLKRAEREARLRAEDAERAKQEVAELNDVLRDTIERLRIAQEAAHSGSWEWNLKSGRVIWSPEEETVYGLAPGTFSGDIEEWRRMVHREDLAKVETAVKQAIDNRTEFHSEFRITRADGAPRWIESFGRLFYDEDGNPERVIGVNADITHRKDIEQALQRSEFRFRRLVDSNIIPILCANLNGITEANDAFLKMIGYTRDDLDNGPIDWIKLTPPEHASKDVAALEELKAKGYCTPFEKEFELPNGRRVPFLIGAVVVNDSPLEWLCFVVDLSQQKRAEAELRRAHDQLEREKWTNVPKSLPKV